MDVASFEADLAAGQMPPSLDLAMQVLWFDARGDWERAHDIAQDLDDAVGSRLHAYLHRKEGDLPNAGYWYRRAGVDVPTVDLGMEWRELVSEFASGP